MFERSDILELIRYSTGGADWLTFGGNQSTWRSIDDWKEFPNESGVYAIGLKLGVKYDGMISKIVYVGSTLKTKMRQRMRTFATGGHNDGLEILRRRFPGGLECSFHILTGIDLEWIRALEDAVMREASRSLGCYPICNIEEIRSKHRDACRGFVRILPSDGLPFPQTLESLKCGFGVLRSHRPATQRDSPKEDCDDERSGLFWRSEVSLWPQEKMQRILELCRQLRPIIVRGNSTVKTFEATARSVPLPDTWGEVALLKAREIAGTFLPTTKIWVKVRFEKVLLGKAMLNKDFYYGEDKSDLPQTLSVNRSKQTELGSQELTRFPQRFHLILTDKDSQSFLIRERLKSLTSLKLICTIRSSWGIWRYFDRRKNMTGMKRANSQNLKRLGHCNLLQIPQSTKTWTN